VALHLLVTHNLDNPSRTLRTFMTTLHIGLNVWDFTLLLLVLSSWSAKELREVLFLFSADVFHLCQNCREMFFC
jgi:hypothetical protein